MNLWDLQKSKCVFSPGEPVSVSVDSNNSTLGLSRLSPGSTYEINVISVLGLDESDPIGDLVTTREWRLDHTWLFGFDMILNMWEPVWVLFCF